MTVTSNLTDQYVVAARFRFLAVVTIGVLLAASACSSDSTAPSGSVDNPDAATSTYPVPKELEDSNEAAVAAYERYWRTVADATAVPDPNFPALDEVASGQALEWARSLVQSGVDEDRRGTGYPSHDAEVTDAYPTTDPTELAIADCMNSTDWLVLDAGSGEPVADEEYGTSQVSALVERVDDRWLVTEVLKQGIGSCLGRSRAGPYSLEDSA